MLKKLILCFYLCFFSDLQAKPLVGSEWIKQLEAEYEQKVYAPFLESLDKKYQEDLKHGRWNAVLRKVPSDSPNYRYPLLDAYQLLRNETIDRVNALCSEHPEAFVSRIIAELKQHPNDHLSVPDAFYDFDNFPALQSEKYASIQDEYTIKRIMIDLMLLNKQVGKSTACEHQFVIQLEKLEKLEAIAIANRDPAATKVIQDSRKQLINMAITQYNYKYLNDLGKGRRKPSSGLEMEVGIVMHQLVNQGLQMLDEIHHFP